MNILHLITQNLGHGSRTRQVDDVVPYPSDFRGKLIHSTTLCIGCGVCAYTCSPGAINISANENQPLRWQYMEDRCTFCGCCVQYCPVQALNFDPESPSWVVERQLHYVTHEVRSQACRECGQPVHVIPDTTLIQLYGKPIPQDIAETQGLCERCRQEWISKRFLTTIVGKGGKNGK